MITQRFSILFLAPILLGIFTTPVLSENIDWSDSSMSSIDTDTIRIYNLNYAPTPGKVYNINFNFDEATLNFKPDLATLEPVDTQRYDTANLSRGGQLYDSWWRTNGESEPSGTHASYPQDTGTQSGSTTWRCKECHGWDYKGKDGAYGNGSDHFTEIKGIFDAQQKPIGEIYSILKNKNLPLSKEDIWDLTRFLKEGLIDMDKYIIFSGELSKTATGTRNNGGPIYSGRCSECHGPDGSEISSVSVGTDANNNPWEVLHKITFGNPGTSMPSMLDKGLSLEQLIDLLTYTQSLPQE